MHSSGNDGGNSGDLDSVQAVQLLEPYGSCDVSDALSKLPYADAYGQLVDIQMVSPNPFVDSGVRICGPAYTVEFVAGSNTTAPKPAAHHVDSCPANAVLVIKTPRGPNAVFGGLMAARAKALNVVGAVIEGRVRDRREMWDMRFPVFATGFSTLGAAPFVRPSRVGESVAIGSESVLQPWADGVKGMPAHAEGVLVATGDIIVGDLDGVVRIPVKYVREVAALCARLTAADERCMIDVRKGRSLADAFAEHRK
ncbi:ribonuclease E inhibitor RraA/Dimethylmenaquinone methyltransferase [Entophlyctis helioformis]|nr:ribonuclease E inhibitor RraA/Dimethylmenaquinone methyltransferase [Entophlyctis helioformis]